MVLSIFVRFLITPFGHIATNYHVIRNSRYLAVQFPDGRKVRAEVVATNPPYAVRVGETERVRNLYAQLGKVMSAKCPGWSVSMFSADIKLERQTGIGLKPLFQTSNGGIRVRVVSGKVAKRRGG